MYDVFYAFLKKKEPTLFPIWFQTKISTKHALIHLKEIIRKQLNDENFGRNMFLIFRRYFVL